MLCELHSVYKIIHCIHCVILHRGSQIIIHYTVKGQFFAFNLEKNYTRQKKFTQTPPVVSVTNMRYAFDCASDRWWILNVQVRYWLGWRQHGSGKIPIFTFSLPFNKIPFTSQRDYGAILMNRVGRKGYKIHIQVVGLLWDFRSKIKGPSIRILDLQPIT